jgi:putative transposase
MPEHIHLLTDEPAIGTLATFLQIFKQLTSRELKPIGQKQFWQRRYYDFNVHT